MCLSQSRQEVYRDLKVNAGDLGEAAKNLVKQGLFLGVMEDAHENTYVQDELEGDDPGASDDDSSPSPNPSAGSEATDDKDASAGSQAPGLPPIIPTPPVAPPARGRSAAEKAQELIELRAVAEAASTALVATHDSVIAAGGEPPPPFAGSKPQPVASVVLPACGGRKGRAGKRAALATMTNLEGQGAAPLPKAQKTKAKAPAPARKTKEKVSSPMQMLPACLSLTSACLSQVVCSGVVKHPEAPDVRLRRIATVSTDESAFTDEYLDNGTEVMVLKTELVNDTKFILVRPKRTRILGYMKGEYVVMDLAEEFDDDDFSEHSEDEGSDCPSSYPDITPITAHCLTTLPHRTASSHCLIALPHRTASLSAGTDNEETFIVETVLEHRRAGRTWEFLIKWEGYGDDDNSWEPRSNLPHNTVLTAYLREHSLA